MSEKPSRNNVLFLPLLNADRLAEPVTDEVLRHEAVA